MEMYNPLAPASRILFPRRRISPNVHDDSDSHHPGAPPPLASPSVYRMTVDEFERIADALNDDQVELVDGYIVGRDDMQPPHAAVTERLRRQL